MISDAMKQAKEALPGRGDESLSGKYEVGTRESTRSLLQKRQTQPTFACEAWLSQEVMNVE